MHDPLAAAISFFALGANLLGTALLLFFNPRNAEVRWFSAFQVAVCAWLLAQGMVFTIGSWQFWGYPHAAAVSLLPGLFLAAALAENRERPNWHCWLAAASGFLIAPIYIFSLRSDIGVWRILLVLWHVVGWSAGAAVMARTSLTHRPAHGGPWTGERLVLLFLMLGAPVSIVVAMLAGAERFFIYMMPLFTVVIQAMMFFGVARMRFYDIEVRVARSGDLAARAAEHERLAVLGELAATLAHEVRNPLTGMRSLTQRMIETDVPLEKRRKYAEVILEEVARLERIVGNLLGAARRSGRQSWDGKPTELEPLFEDLQLLVQGRAREANVRIAADAGRLTVNAPREALAQALLNLLLNAIRHAPVGSTVQLIAITGAAGTEIIVRDEGPGVPVANREQIFEPFQSGNNGTGLGLSVVRSLARELGWEVRVANADDGGAIFGLKVPVTAEPVTS